MRTTVGLKVSQYIINTGKAWVASELGIYGIFKMGRCHTVRKSWRMSQCGLLKTNIFMFIVMYVYSAEHDTLLKQLHKLQALK